MAEKWDIEFEEGDVESMRIYWLQGMNRAPMRLYGFNQGSGQLFMSHSAPNPGYITIGTCCDLRFSRLDTACQLAVSSELRMEDLWSSKIDLTTVFAILRTDPHVVPNLHPMAPIAHTFSSHGLRDPLPL